MKNNNNIWKWKYDIKCMKKLMYEKKKIEEEEINVKYGK